jgi:5'-methylthioadenosine phosphorylase
MKSAAGRYRSGFKLTDKTNKSSFFHALDAWQGSSRGGNFMEYPAPVLGVIGGSGLYNMEGLEGISNLELSTPFGKPSSPITIGRLDGKPVAFLSRHGLGHTISPSEINYRANIYAMKMVGVKRLVSVSACGSLREDYAPGHIVIPNQLFDFTRGTRERTFFNSGWVAHIGAADPFCPETSQLMQKSLVEVGAEVHPAGTLITIEGPRFSTKAESNTFRAWGIDIIGMTACPEVFLAREAELCIAIMAHVTDYDVWHVTEKPVTVDMVVSILRKNTQLVQAAIRTLVSHLPEKRSCPCPHILDHAMITSPEYVTEEARQRLGLITEGS